MNLDLAIHILEEALNDNYEELSKVINHTFGKNKFTHVFFFFFKHSLHGVLKKQGIPKSLI